MRAVDVVRGAFRNAFRSRVRTGLTVLAVFIGAFTLSLTNGLGTGINAFVDSTVASVGVDDVMTVTRVDEEAAEATSTGPREYDPDQLAGQEEGMLVGGTEAGALALTEADLAAIGAVDGVLRVEPVETAVLDYVQHDGGTPYVLGLSQLVPGMQVELAAGEQVDLDAAGRQLVLPESYVEPLGLGSAEDAVGATVDLALTDAAGEQVTAEATVVGVAAAGLVASDGAVPNAALASDLHALQQAGAPAGQEATWPAASVWFDADAGDEATTALKDRLDAAGYTAATLDDQLGSLTSVIDTVVLVLNGFAVIALLAAGIGIVNTLFMAAQERTREVGLMKAMGLSSGRVFALFSIEAVVMGLLGSALGTLAAFGVGRLAGAVLSGGLLADLPGLTLVAFEPATVAAVVLGVMALAFAAGTLPALRAARHDPITSLRYE